MTLIALGELVAAVGLVGHTIAENFAKPHDVTHKDDGTPVTPVDIEVNRQLANYARLWNYAFIGEEGNGDLTGDYCLYVDPLDGTGAFMRGIATTTVVASIMHEGSPLHAVIHNPVTKQTWAASKGGGAWYAIGHTTLTRTFVASQTPKSRVRTAICSWPGVDTSFADFQKRILESPLFSDQQMGAFAIGGGLIASGLIHATAISATSAVETAAMSLIVKEAGGVARDLHGNQLDSFELGEHKGKMDYLLPNGALMACDESVALTMLLQY